MNLGRKEILLIALLAVLVLVLGRQILRSTGVVGGPRTPEATEADVSEARALIASLPPLELEARRSGDLYQFRRNIFEFTRCAADLEAERRQQEAAERARQARQDREEQRQTEAREQVLAARAAREAQPGRAHAPTPRFSYIGYMGEVGDWIAVFEMRGGDAEIVIAKQGDVIEDTFVVDMIDWDRVELTFTDPQFSDQRKTLPMEGLDS